MIFSWLKRRRRARLLAKPFPENWNGWLARTVPHWARLSGEERDRLRDLVRVFIAEKTWEGSRGQEVTEEMKVVIAGQACLLLLGLEHDHFRNVKTIVVFPRQFVPHEMLDFDDQGIAHESQAPALGLAYEGGPVILSWADARAGGRNSQDGLNVVLHEFAHKLDLHDGVVNGTPVLRNRRDYARWAEVMRREYDTLVEASRKGRATLLDDYGATDPGEFFAVAVECFFEKPIQLCKRHADLYEVLRGYFGQDPAQRLRMSRRDGIDGEATVPSEPT